MPQRIQRRRVKGWRMPAGAVNVCRPTKWGNPFFVSRKPVSPEGRAACAKRGYYEAPTKAYALLAFRAYAIDRASADPQWLAPLRGKNLACFCSLNVDCHADILLELANPKE